MGLLLEAADKLYVPEPYSRSELALCKRVLDQVEKVDKLWEENKEGMELNTVMLFKYTYFLQMGIGKPGILIDTAMSKLLEEGKRKSQLDYLELGNDLSRISQPTAFLEFVPPNTLRIISANQELAKLFRKHKKAMLGKNLLEHIPQPMRKAIESSLSDGDLEAFILKKRSLHFIDSAGYLLETICHTKVDYFVNRNFQ